MLIAGFNKTSLLDFPGKISAVVFTPYCNMRCTYCHNLHLLSDPSQRWTKRPCSNIFENGGICCRALW